MIILETSVLSALMRAQHDPAVADGRLNSLGGS
jgi:hypothetical protein